MRPTLEDFRQWYNLHEEEIFRDYFTFLRFPSISTDPAFAKDVQACANWLAEYLRGIGLDVQIWPTSTHPVIFASHTKAGPSSPTLLVYNHYDVQPVDPLELWQTPPFEPAIRNRKVYARGASDNKGQLFYMITALRAFLDMTKEHKFNLKLFIEGEEECGSVGTREIFAKKREVLQADHCLILDAGLPKQGVPAVTLGMRGIVTMNVTLKNSSIDLHSGIFGGIVLNPNQALVTLLASLWANGRVAVPGFYDDLVPIDSREWEVIDHAFDRKEYVENFGIHAFGGEAGYSLHESNWIRPTIEINGISGGYTGQGFKTVIPSLAQAKISCRLVSRQEPEKIAALVADHLRRNLPKGLAIDLEIHAGGSPVQTPSQAPIVQLAKKAYEEVFRSPCRFIFCPASVPIVAELAEAVGAPVALMGTSLSEDDIHAPNEHFGLDQFEQGFLTMGSIFSFLT